MEQELFGTYDEFPISQVSNYWIMEFVLSTFFFGWVICMYLQDVKGKHDSPTNTEVDTTRKKRARKPRRVFDVWLIKRAITDLPYVDYIYVM